MISTLHELTYKAHVGHALGSNYVAFVVDALDSRLDLVVLGAIDLNDRDPILYIIKLCLSTYSSHRIGMCECAYIHVKTHIMRSSSASRAQGSVLRVWGIVQPNIFHQKREIVSKSMWNRVVTSICSTLNSRLEKSSSLITIDRSIVY